MVSKKKSDWPPPGWKVEIKVSFNGRHYKCYINSKTGKKFYSKLALLRYIKDGSRGNQKFQSHTTKQHSKMNQGIKQTHLLEANDSLDLPPGWTIEQKTRLSGSKRGTTYKCFIEKSTGSKFYSMPEVYRYLKSTKGNAGSSAQTKRGRIGHSSNNRSVDPLRPHKLNFKKKLSEAAKPNIQKRLSSGKMKVVIETTSDEDLPSGWIKEMRIKHRGENSVRRDPFYIEPVTGLVFRSKPEVLRYLETGEISKHAYRRKNKNIDEKEFPVEKTLPTSSSNIEKTRKSGNRKDFLADEASPKQSISAPQEAADNKETQSKRSTRSSSKVVSASTCEPCLEQIALLPEPAKTVQAMVPAKHLLADEASPKRSISAPQEAAGNKETQSKRRTRSSAKAVSASTCEPSLEQIALLPESAKTAQAMVPAKHLLADEASPKQSISEAAGNKEAQSKRRTRSSSKVVSASTCEPSMEQRALLAEPAKTAQAMVPAKHLLADEASPKQSISVAQKAAGNKEAQSKRRTRSSSKVVSASTCEPSLEQIALLPEPATTAQAMVPAKPTGQVSDIEAIEGVTELALPKVQVDEKENNAALKKMEPSASPKHKSDVKLQKCSVEKTRINKRRIKDREVSSLPSRSSKRLAGVEAEVVLHTIPIEHAGLATKRSSSKTNGIPGLELISSESQERAPAVNDLQNVVASQQEKTQAFNVDTPQVDALEKIDSLSEENGKKIFWLDEQPPPGFSQHPKANISQMMIDQLFEDPADTMTESMMEKPPEEHKIPEVQPDTLCGGKIGKSSGDCPVLDVPTANLERDSEQPGSQFCFPSPLWSDPCLEFAFKTLTGAIPLDDNVAIQDYIQHQLRTSEQSNNNRGPDIGVPNFGQSEETKLVPPLPEDANFPKSNGFSSHKSSR